VPILRTVVPESPSRPIAARHYPGLDQIDIPIIEHNVDVEHELLAIKSAAAV